MPPYGRPPQGGAPGPEGRYAVPPQGGALDSDGRYAGPPQAGPQEKAGMQDQSGVWEDKSELKD